MADRLRVKRRLYSVNKNVEQAAEDIAALREKLTAEYFDNRSRMGQSGDLEMTDQRYEAAMGSLSGLEEAVSSYAELLKGIRKNYRDCQERAITRANMIPK